MSKRLTGLNPLAYIGVEATTPPQMILAKENPTPTDSKNVNLGDMWLNEETESLYVLVSLAQGVATWVTTFGGATSDFVTDNGTAVDSGGIINVAGGDLINTAGSGNTITINLTNGADGTIPIGGGSAPIWTLPTSNDGSIDFSVGNNSLDLSVDKNVVIGNGTDGQVLIGGGLAPEWANITSNDNSITITNGANTIDLSAPTATGLTTIHTNSGDANQAAGAVTIHGDGTTLETTGSGSTVDIALVNGTDGQLLIGGGASPAWANLTSMGGTVTITNGANTINLEATGGGSSGASTFITDSGNALENLGDITIAGGHNISTSGAGQTVTVNVSGTTNHALQIGNSTGSLTSLAVASNGEIPIGSSGSNPVLATLTAGSGINITNGAGSITIAATGGGGGGGVTVTTFNTPGSFTFEKGTSTKYIEVYGWNGGGGGGSGAVVGSGTAQGGGGGGCGGFFRFAAPALFVGDSVDVTVGVGGTGGASVSGTQGNEGVQGTRSSFGAIITPTIVQSAANSTPSSQAGGGGNAISQSTGSGAGGAFLDSMANRVFLTATLATNRNGVPVAGYVPYSLTNNQGGHGSTGVGADGQYLGGDGGPGFGFVYYLPTSGAQGGSVDNLNTVHNGGSGGTVYALDGSTVLAAGGAFGASGGFNAGDGVDQVLNPATNGGFIFGGTGGGGGGANGSGAGGRGGDGGFPGGGGGGGGGARSGLSGAGGHGADGLVIVIEWA